jgi:hypothetical protein
MVLHATTRLSMSGVAASLAGAALLLPVQCLLYNTTTQHRKLLKARNGTMPPPHAVVLLKHVTTCHCSPFLMRETIFRVEVMPEIHPFLHD